MAGHKARSAVLVSGVPAIHVFDAAHAQAVDARRKAGQAEEEKDLRRNGLA